MSLPPLAEILAKLPDNTVGSIEPVDLRQIFTALYSGINDNEEDINSRVSKLGDEVDGYLSLLKEPVLPQHAATKSYIDKWVLGTGFLPLTGGELTGDLILTPTPASALSAVNKAYADMLAPDFFDTVKDGIIFTDGSTVMVDNYSPSVPMAVATRKYVDSITGKDEDALLSNPIATQVIFGGFGLRMSSGFEVTNANDLVHRAYVDKTLNEAGYLQGDGTVSMDAGYEPIAALDISTKAYTDAQAALRGDLFADGSVLMDQGYTPANDLSLATAGFVVSTVSNAIENIDAGDLYADGSVLMADAYYPDASKSIATLEYVVNAINSADGGGGGDILITPNTWAETQTFSKNAVLQSVGSDAGGTSGASIEYKSSNSGGVLDQHYAAMGALDGNAFIGVYDSNNNNEKTAQWNFTKDALIVNNVKDNLKHNVAIFTISTTGAIGDTAPDGWTAQRNSLGDYLLTHNLNKPNILPACMGRSGSTGITVNYADINNNVCRFLVRRGDTNALINNSFNVMIAY